MFNVPPIYTKHPILKDFLQALEFGTVRHIDIDQFSHKLVVQFFSTYMLKYANVEYMELKYDPTMDSIFILDPYYNVLFPNRVAGNSRDYDNWNKLKSISRFLEDDYYFQASLVMDLKFVPDEIRELKQWYKVLCSPNSPYKLRQGTFHNAEHYTAAIQRFAQSTQGDSEEKR